MTSCRSRERVDKFSAQVALVRSEETLLLPSTFALRRRWVFFARGETAVLSHRRCLLGNQPATPRTMWLGFCASDDSRPSASGPASNELSAASSSCAIKRACETQQSGIEVACMYGWKGTRTWTLLSQPMVICMKQMERWGSLSAVRSLTIWSEIYREKSSRARTRINATS